jgi:hypothetical protein
MLLPAACSYDFDQFAPGSMGADASLGGQAGAGASAGSGATGSGASAGSGGTAGASGSGGVSGASGSGGASGGTGGSGGASGSGGTGGTDAGGPTVSSYSANVSDCIALTSSPDPDFCEAKSGPTEMSVDLVDDELAPDGGAPPASAAFLRFNLDGAIAGKTVTKVELELTAASTSGADSPQAGEIWRVASFTRTALFTAAPNKQGGAPIASSFGPVATGQVVTWTLPNGSVQANTPVYLGIFAASNNGVRYVNGKGTKPPKLTITASP